MLRKFFNLALLSSCLLGAGALQANDGCCDLSPCCGSWAVYGDFLYWRAVVNDLPYAVTGNVAVVGTPGTVITTIDNMSLREITFDYDPGFRVGVGYESSCGWQVTAEYTRFHTSSRSGVSGGQALRSVADNGNFIIDDIWFNQISFFKSAIAARQLSHFDQGKILFATPYYVCSRFAFRPTFGGVAAWLNQKLLLNRDVFFFLGDTPFTGTSNTLLRNFFKGAGLDLGWDSSFRVWKCLNLFGRGSYSLLWGRYDLLRRDFTTTTATTLSFFGNNQATHEHGLANCFDIHVGLEGSWSVCNCQLISQVGYEFMYWLDQVRIRGIFPINQSSDAVAIYGKGNVGYHGLTWRFLLTY